MAKHWFPVFSSDKCHQCEACLLICPVHIIELTELNGNFIPALSDSDECLVNCFKCVKICPNNAVGIIRPAKPCDCCSF
ncbi:hypothetical protein MmiHf6_17230 [Methanimicrococcus hongohii]|uniref:4Fe-4S ferredoxin-type domain-containing protein n=1 Tax=Methanimicrococcus hongohii TaxID=3028295 RepID=A0AA96VCS9_9EURY|nr:4Fe-4S dicluster domain-containing protein [Methanimicrococcus sp. Hf6]WNY24392.1 hypothetical protein MmiHf6_17230 [Methanimicrococcus sp. Hf6]